MMHTGHLRLRNWRPNETRAELIQAAKLSNRMGPPQHNRLRLDVEPVAEVVPERDAEFAAGVHQAEEGVATVTSCFAVGATTDLALDDVAANVAFGPVGVQRYFRPVEHRQQLCLVGMQPLKQAIERDETCAAVKDTIEAGVHLAAASGGWGGAIGLEVGIEPPDQRADALLGGAVQIGESVELVHQPLRVDPAQRMPTDDELTGIIADHDGIAQEAMVMDAAPQSALGGDLHRVRGDLQSADTQAIEMDLPGGLMDKACLRLRRQLADHRSGKRAAAHVVHCRLIDHIVAVSGAQQVEEVQSFLEARVPNQVKLSLPICVQKPFLPACRAPVSSTVIQAAVCRPARSTSRLSVRNAS